MLNENLIEEIKQLQPYEMIEILHIFIAKDRNNHGVFFEDVLTGEDEAFVALYACYLATR